MEFHYTIYGILASFFLFFYYMLSFSWSNKPKHTSHNAPPEAGGARLFTGHLHLMSGGSSTTLPHFNLANLADKHGPIFTIRLGVRRAVVVSSWEIAKELFTTCDAHISSRPRLRATEHLSCNLAMFGFSPYGPYWRQIRKLVTTELLSARRLELQRDVRVSENAILVDTLYKLWEEKRDGSGRVLVDMKQCFGELNLNVILRVVAGRRFHGGGDSEETRCREVMREFFYLAGLFVPADALPYLKWLDIGGYERRMKRNARDFDRIVGGWVAGRCEKEYSGEGKPQDFIDVMLSALKAADLPYDVHTVTKATCMVLISGATDTTTVMLIWALSLIMNNGHVLKRAQQELDKHVGRERRVDESDIKNLVYLQAIVKETLRLYPAGPIGGIREFAQECNVGGYFIPKGTWLIVNVWKLQRDTHVWPDDPSEFRPERFLDRHKSVDVKGQDFELIPFGAGRRICPGANLGLHMLHLALANLLQAFELSTVGDEEIDMSESAGLTNLKATPLEVLISPRLAPTLYSIS
uniref:Flavonoid-6-hydroxylase n=1 Tax=Plectranthus barbatus TaxID=41228 RepID=A0A1B0VRP6_9LAMI|nr:cytochrome P450 CYP82D63 [Plectranthus barbatus]